MKLRKKDRCDGLETRRSLLAAAAEVFSEKGFWEATNAEICARAGANNAAVNYHFRSKENLYVEAWKDSFARSLANHPAGGGVGPKASVAERLRGHIFPFMQRIADPGTHDIEIMHKEMACPTGLLTEAIRESVEPQRLVLESIIREILGPRADGETVRFCHMNILALCFGPMLKLRRLRINPGEALQKAFPADFEVESFARHTARFIVAGIKAARSAKRPGKTGRGPVKAKRRSD